MKYAIIPTHALVHLLLHYKVISQLFVGENETIIIPFLLIEDRFSSGQILEIETNGGVVFNDKNEYLNWLENQKETI